MSRLERGGRELERQEGRPTVIWEDRPGSKGIATLEPVRIDAPSSAVHCKWFIQTSRQLLWITSRYISAVCLPLEQSVRDSQGVTYYKVVHCASITGRAV
jgi:hypothetical protein